MNIMENKKNLKNILDSYYVLDINRESYIKRLIALPGEHVVIKDGKVYINNEELKENYLQDGVQTELKHGIGFDDFIVSENCIFAMGDNRAGSMDCRDFGCIPLEKKLKVPCGYEYFPSTNSERFKEISTKKN